MKLRNLRFVLLAGVVLVLVSFSRPAERYFEIAKSLDIFTTLFKEVNAYYVDEVDPRKLVDRGISSMLESLDPYTHYIPEEDLEAFSIQTTGQYAGIGALIGQVNKKTVVTHPYFGFAAYRSGVRVGDEFVQVDGQDVRGRPTTEVSALLKGKPKTTVEIVLRREGVKDNLTFNLERERIKISNVVYEGMLDNNTGYIKLDDFTPGAGGEVEQAVVRLKQAGAKSLILDLRDNPGGLLYEAVNIVNIFIPKGKEVVSTKGKVQDWNKTYTTLNEPIDQEIPLAVLTSGGSASAAEIVAGALQDYDRAILVGQRTFGKGLVQTTRPLSYNAQLKVTTAKYHIPSGRCIQALDYANRKTDGSVERFADSVKTAFKTVSGRKVFDGGGLDPDVAVSSEAFGAIGAGLLSSSFAFEYATKFVAEHPTIPATMIGFRMSDQEYQKFVAWIKAQDFEYPNILEQQTEQLIASARNERYYDELSTGLNQLKTRLRGIRDSDYVRFRKEISAILEDEIAFHYSLHKGRTELMLDRQPEILEASRILHDPAKYRSLLQPR